MVSLLYNNLRYEPDETYESKFGHLAEIFTNCRAELCSLFFVYIKEVHEIFDIDDSLFDNIIYTIWIMFIREALLSLKYYNVEKKQWDEGCRSHLWLIVNYLLNNLVNGQEIMNLLVNEEKKSYKITVNKYINYYKSCNHKIILEIR